MELYFITRGIQQQEDIFKIFIQSQMWPWPRKNTKTGEDFITMFQGGLQPINLWSYRFPKDCLHDVLKMLEINPNEKKLPYSDVVKGINFNAMILRKMLNAKKLPQIDIKDNFDFGYRYIERRGLNIMPIGLREDKEGKGVFKCPEFPEGTDHELL